MRSASGAHINLTSPREQDGQRKVGRRSESKKPDSLTRLDAGNPQTSEADDSRAKKGSRRQIVQTWRKRKKEIRASQRELRISAVHRVAGEDRGVAQIFETKLAVGASAIHAADPRDPHPRACRKLGSCAIYHFADDLVLREPEDRAERAARLFDDVQISAADARTRQYAKGETWPAPAWGFGRSPTVKG